LRHDGILTQVAVEALGRSPPALVIVPNAGGRFPGNVASMRPTMRLTVPLLLLALAGVPTAAVAATDAATGWYDHLRAARAALARDDLAAARPELQRVDSLVGGHSGAVYALAAIAARAGEQITAVRLLRRYAETGLARDVRGDTAFAGLRDDPEFQAIAARLDSNAAPIAKAKLVARLDDPALLAEDVAWDARRNRFLVSSIHRRKIVAISRDGRVTNFISPGRDGVWGIFGLALDADRDRLWATTAAGPTSEAHDSADAGRTALLAYDLATSQLLERIELLRDSSKHVLGDLTLGPDGTVYVTESIGGGIYRLNRGAPTLDTLAPSGTFLSPQMPALAADGKRLLIADYPRGVAALDLGTHEVTWLAKPTSLASGGLDGLYLAGDRMIAIQNGSSPKRVLELTLNPAQTAIVGWRVLEQGSEWLGEPNHGVFVGRDFVFVGNSGWERVNEREELETPDDARSPVLLRLRSP
jgi:sugar lactone lactonase YvrE